MGTIKVANVHFTQSGNNRLDYANGVVRLVSNNGLVIPFGTLAERPIPQFGMIRINGESNAIEFYNSSWITTTANTDLAASFLQANAAYSKANSASIDAVAAFGAANTAAAAGGPAFAQANLVFGVVNVAFGQANTAYNRANSANIDAVAAFAKANIAFTTANTGAFPSGTAMLFLQTAAPTGWTKSTTHNDKAIRIVSGTASNGGSVAFSTAFASKSVSGTVGSTTISSGQMPSHVHGSGMSAGGGGGVCGAGSLGAASSTGGAGGDGSHNHSFSGTAIDMTVQYVDAIIATKD